MQEIDLYQRSSPTCPHCGYSLNHDDMQDDKTSDCEDLYALATDEDRAVVVCPKCDAEYWVLGGYRPHYTSAFSEELL